MEGNGESYQEYPPYQGTYMKGEINFTVRGDSWEEVIQNLYKMKDKWRGLVGNQGEVSSLDVSEKENGETVGHCPECGADLKFKEGVSKTGKPYKGNFCTNRACKYVEWLS